MDSWLTVVALVKNPILVFILAVFGLLAFVIIRLLQSVTDHVGYERELNAQLNENSKTLARLAALLETLVHGRGGQK